MRNIVVIAFQLHYSKGSEYSVAWNYIKNMSQKNKLTVIYGTCEGHHDIGNTKVMEEYAQLNPMKNVTFVAFKPSFKSHNYDYSNFGQYRFYKEYKKWHKEVRAFIVGLSNKQQIDLIHYLGPIGYREPGFLYNLDIPYVWGPIGGLGGVNLKLLKATGSLSLSAHYLIKRVLNEIQSHFSIRIRKALKFSDVVICATSENQDIVNKLIGHKHHCKVLFTQENCLERVSPLNEEKFSKKTHLIFIGSIDGRKGLPFIIEALKGIPSNSEIELDVVGDGSAKELLVVKAQKAGVGHFINWHGNVPRERVYELLRNAHLMVLPSLAEGNPTTVWEAMSQGVPSLSLHNCGMRDTISNDTGFSIPIISYKQIVKDITSVLNEIITNPTILQDKAFKVLEDRKRYLWDDRKMFFEKVYELAEEQYSKRHKQ